MRKIFVLIGVALLVAGVFFLKQKTQEARSCIGIVVPVEHRAMTEMVRGFKEIIREELGSDIKIDVQNAGGDLNIQSAIIAKFKRSKYTHVVPIGTDVTLMTLNTVKEKQVVGLDITDRVTQTQANITGVRESSIIPSYQFLQALFHPLKKVTFIYSSSDKNHQLVENFSELAQKEGVLVQKLMIQSLADLYVLANRVDSNSDAIFIAKDHLVASGASALAYVAEKLQIPLITSDEGSVFAGGAVAIGNKEEDIGRAGGKILVDLIRGKNPHEIPIKPLNTFTVFVNMEALKKQGLDFTLVEKAASTLGYGIQRVSN